jgi:hypothetical protein
MRTVAAVVTILGHLAFLAPGVASAQSIGTYQWQLAPFCNTITVTVTAGGGVYTLDGFDNQCGAPQRAPIVGVATPNPDGTIGLGLQIVTVPGGRVVGVDARISLSGLGGPWTDSAGNSGTMVFNGPGTGSVRPLPSAAPAWGTVIDAPASPGTFGLVVRNADPGSAPAPAVMAQVGAPSTLPITAASVALIGQSRDFPGVLGVSDLAPGMIAYSLSGPGMIGATFSPTAPGVLAGSATGGVALELAGGAVKVSGTVRPAFVHVASAGNTFANSTTLDHPLLNDDPNAMVFITHDYGVAGAYTYWTHPTGIYYTGTRWAIYAEDLASMPLGLRFNVLVIKR